MKLALKIPLAFAAATAAMLVAAWYGVFSLSRAVGTYETTVLQAEAHALAAAELSSTFKTQVQEWKNTLIRGKDAKALERHWGAFNKLQTEITQKAQKVEASLAAGAQSVY